MFRMIIGWFRNLIPWQPPPTQEATEEQWLLVGLDEMPDIEAARRRQLEFANGIHKATRYIGAIKC